MEIQDLLRETGKKITPERIQLAEWMQNQHIFTANEVLQSFSTVSRASIFRTLKLFCEIGYLRSSIIGATKESSYVLAHTHHHEHLQCNTCGEVSCLDSDDIYAKIYESARKIGFQITNQSLNIAGDCKNCV